MSALFHGMEPKSAAFEFRCTEAYIYRLYMLMGMRRRYITQQEYDAIMAQRKNSQPKQIAA